MLICMQQELLASHWLLLSLSTMIFNRADRFAVRFSLCLWKNPRSKVVVDIKMAQHIVGTTPRVEEHGKEGIRETRR